MNKLEKEFREKFGHIKNKGVIIDDITLDNLLNFTKEKIKEYVNKIEMPPSNYNPNLGIFFEKEILFRVRELIHNQFIQYLEQKKKEIIESLDV